MVAISGRYIILIGDGSDHGGTVITGDPIATINGIPCSRINDLHACPQKYGGKIPHGVTPILPTGCIDSRGLIKGRPMALENDKTLCGASVQSSQNIGASRC